MFHTRVGTLSAVTVLLSACAMPPAEQVEADAGVSRGALLASMCSTCHGTDGTGSKSIPQLAGIEADDLFETMKAFASGEEEATIMGRHAAGYTDDELKAIADYFANLE